MVLQALPAYCEAADCAIQGDRASNLDAGVALVAAEEDCRSCDTWVVDEVEDLGHACLDKAMACAVEVVEEPSCQADTDAASPLAVVLVVRTIETADAGFPLAVVPMV